MHIINPDDVLTALYQRLNADTVFRGMVNGIDKGPKRGSGHKNPSATVHLLTLPMDGELDTYRSTAVVNVYMDDLPTGQMDSSGLGQRAERVQYLFRRAHLPTHPEGLLTHPNVEFKTVYVMEPLLLPSDVEGEHVASVRIGMILKRRS